MSETTTVKMIDVPLGPGLPRARVEAADQAEDRVDEHSLSMLRHLGFNGRLPDGLVAIFNDYKRAKDRIQPGRLTAEGFATVVTLYQLAGR